MLRYMVEIFQGIKLNSRIRSLSAALRSGEITARGLAEEYIKKIEEENPLVNAYVRTCFEKTLADADRADRMLAEGCDSLLCGIPYALKDNICTKGLETACCSRMLTGHRPIYNAEAVEKLEAAGAVLLGKTNMDEFAMGSSTETGIYGPAKNPGNLSLATGGSSGGSAAAVAAGLAVFALGSDTGGSVRQPAAFCNVTGFKPEYDAISRYGLIAYASSLDTIGVLAESPEDAMLVYEAIKDRSKSINAGLKKESPQNPILGIIRDVLEKAGPEIKDEFLLAADCLARKGFEIKEIRMPEVVHALPAYYIIACAEAASNLGRYDGLRYGYRSGQFKDFNEMFVRTRSEGFGKEVKKRIMFGNYVLAGRYHEECYKKAWSLRRSLSAKLDEALETCDFLLTPTVGRRAFKLGELAEKGSDMYRDDLNTVIANISGLPAMSVPSELILKKGDRPSCGIQFMGRRGADEDYINLAEILSAYKL